MAAISAASELALCTSGAEVDMEEGVEAGMIPISDAVTVTPPEAVAMLPGWEVVSANTDSSDGITATGGAGEDAVT